ncbi:MAG: transcriptional regulator [Bdellovibrionales bacterium GWA2_49_15]|nr:MAG: transcriptional regulator [Bdellovibrionales bacterium GWA2_49_15]HAZ13013.1 arsenical resistance operon transcriptional repressor ArsD [Bdellovibrionales bacterium]
MATIQIYEGALCCSTGICGVDPDQQLISFAADVEWIKKNGGKVERYNLAQQPLAFAENAIVKKFLENFGQEGLPVTIVKGEVVLTSQYPERSELAHWAGITAGFTNIKPAGGGGCCSGGSCS